MKTKIKKILKFSFLISAIFILSFFSLKKSRATDCEGQCKTRYTDSDQINQCQKECSDLENKAKVYKQNLKINNKTQSLLANQLNDINQRQAINRQNLQQTQNQLDKLSREINSLKNDIAEKEKEISNQKKILAGLMQSYYDYDQQGLLEIVLINKELFTSLSQSDYIEQSEVKVSDILANFQTIKQQLDEASQKLQNDYDKNSQLKQKLKYEKNNLQSSENQKQWLFQKTQGEEEKYKEMLANIERQKEQLFDFSSASNLGEVLSSVNKYPKPDKSDWASTSWYFSQTDSRWANQKIGNSNSLMKNYGCAVTSVAMVFRKYNSHTDPEKLAKEKIFYYDLIEWPKSWSPGISLISSTSHGNVSWSTINSQIKKGHPVIVHIRKNNGRGGHYVVITGKDSKDYIVHDPYFGPNLYLGTSRSLIGQLGANSSTTVDQMIIYN